MNEQKAHHVDTLIFLNRNRGLYILKQVLSNLYFGAAGWDISLCQEKVYSFIVNCKLN